MGMPGHLYLFFDETGGAHPANLTGVTPAIWAKETNLRRGSVFISVARGTGPDDGKRVAKMRVGLSREESVGNSKARRVRRGGIRFELLRRTRWLRAAISVSSCENDREAEIANSLD